MTTENNQATEAPPKAPIDGGKLIVLTAPLTEIIDHAGYFIQMSMASLPIWLEGILNKKYPRWRDLEYNDDQSAPMIDYLGQGGCETIRALLVSVASIPTDVRWMLGG